SVFASGRYGAVAGWSSTDNLHCRSPEPRTSVEGHKRTFALQSRCPLYPQKRKWFSTVVARAAASTRRTRALMTMPTNVLRLMDANRVGLAKASLNDNV